jgi:hypothetical protein
VPVPGLRLSGRAVSAPAHGATTLALAGREAGRLPKNESPPKRDDRRGIRTHYTKSKSLVLYPYELVAGEAEGNRTPDPPDFRVLFH